MLSLKNIIVLATAASALVIERTPAQVLTNLKTIDSNTNSLTSTVTGWDGSLLGALSINSAESTLENSIKSATTSAQSEPVASSSDSQSIISYITGSLEPDIKKAITALTAKKSQFQSAGLVSLVQTDLGNLKNETDSLGAVLVKVASADQKTNANSALSKIDADFQSAIAAFA